MKRQNLEVGTSSPDFKLQIRNGVGCDARKPEAEHDITCIHLSRVLSFKDWKGGKGSESTPARQAPLWVDKDKRELILLHLDKNQPDPNVAVHRNAVALARGRQNIQFGLRRNHG